MLLKNGKILGKTTGCIEFDEKIKKIGKSAEGDGIDLHGALVLPGFIDIHAHLRAPRDQSYKEDFITGGKAAAHGGVTELFDMPNKSPQVLSLDDIETVKSAAKACIVKVHPYILASANNVDVDYRYVKIIYGGTTGAEGLPLEFVGQHLKRKNRIHVVHCEDPKYFVKTENHCEARPAIAEHEAISQIKSVADGCVTPGGVSDGESVLHFTHLTTARSVEYASPFTCDTTPHYLFLSTKDYERLGPLAKMNPALRSPADVAALRASLGRIYCIASDHAPHTLVEKRGSNPPSGVPELDTYVPLLMEGVEEGWMSLQDLLDKCVYNPAKMMGLDAGIGAGKPAVMVILEKKPWKVNSGCIQSKCGWSPYEEKELKWQVRATIVNGSLVYGAL